MLLSPPLGLAACVLFRNEIHAAPAYSQALQPPHYGWSPRTSVAEQNLDFILLAALAGGPACACRLTLRVLSSSAIFLTLSRRRIDSEIGTLQALGLIEAAPSGACGCSADFALSAAGRQALDDALRYCRVAGLVPPTPREVKE
jgi:hypothetical protein